VDRFNKNSFAGHLSSIVFQTYAYQNNGKKPSESGAVLHFLGEESILDELIKNKSEPGYLIDRKNGYGS